ncbi:MAG: CRTAC1 family protein, partial [Bryobacteraceae bacterium]
DFLITGLTRNFLFHNDGHGGFREMARDAGVLRDGIFSAGAAFGDLDGDGRLDLYVAAYLDLDFTRLPKRGSDVHCTYKGLDVFCGPRGMKPAAGALFHNEGEGKFRDITRESGIASAAPPFYSLQPLVADFDGDGRPDIFVANDSTPNYLFHNEGNLKFTETGIAAGVAVNMDGRAQASMGVDFADYNGDGAPDLAVTNFSEDTNTLYRNLRSGFFEDVSWPSKIGPASWLFLGWGLKFFDFDHDGWLDVIIANGHVYPEADRFQGGSTYRQRLLLHRNLGDGTFAEIGATDTVLAAALTARGLAAGDIDNDGDLDVLINNQDAAPRLLRNDLRTNAHWLEVDLIGHESNRDGVGAVVTLRAGARKWTAMKLAGDSYFSSSDPRLHFGLGAVKVVDELALRWPSGKSQKLTAVAADRLIRIEEPVAP